MDNLPKELEETQLSMQVIIDPETKCITMRTQAVETETNTSDTMTSNAIPNDPLLNSQTQTQEEPDFDKMSELEKLIYEERARLLNIKTHKKPAPGTKRKPKRKSFLTDTLTNREKTRIGMRKLREQETPDEKDARRFRHRIFTLKLRLMQRLKNFDDDTFLKEQKERNTARIKEKRLQRKATETPEERAKRKNEVNRKSRLAKKRLRAFKTPEELLADKDKRLAYLDKFWARHTEEERQALMQLSRDKAKERHKRKTKEWKAVQKYIKGGEPVEKLQELVANEDGEIK